MSEPTGTQYGGFWIRFLALLADSAIVFVLSTALLVGATIALGPDDMTVAVIAVGVLGFLYWPILHASRLRATFGKAILGLHVTRFDGRRISILRAVWREIAKIFSSAVFMLGYVIAAVTPRKQALHDLMAATYVSREGVSRVFPALLIVLAGFATPVFVAPMVVDRAVQSAMEKIVMDAIAQYDPMKQQTRPAAPAMKVAPRTSSPAPVQVAKAAPVAPKVEAPAPKPAPVALAQPEPAKAVQEPVKVAPEPVKAAPEPAKAAPEPVKAVPEAAKTVKEPVKPKAAAKQKQGPVAVARVARPSPASSDFMLASGLKHNDLMTAVLAHDAASVSELLKLGKWVDKPDSQGRTPLMVATALDDVPTAEALLRGGASPSPAVRVAQERRNGEMVALLKRYGGR